MVTKLLPGVDIASLLKKNAAATTDQGAKPPDA
jgi:hypothetical protein